MAEEKILLFNSQGKQGTSLPLVQYNQIKEAIVEVFLQRATATAEEITNLVSQKIADSFEGDIPWHVEAILPDLQARQYIEQVPGSEPAEFRLNLIRC